MQDRQILPRWFVLRKLIRVVSLLALIYILIYGGIARMSFLDSSRIPAAYFAFAVPSAAELVLLVPFTLFALGLIALLRNHALLESEQYLILVTLALVLSTWFGVANYAIYMLRPDAFSVD